MILATLAAVATAADAGAMTAIASTTVSSATTTVTLSSIPQTFDDLRVVVYDSGGSGATNAGYQFNSDTATNYSTCIMYGDTTAFYALRTTSANSNRIYVIANPSAHTIDIMSYANTSTLKQTLIRTASDNNGTGEVSVSTSLWRSTSAITSITFTITGTRNWQPGTIFSLYGIKRAV